MYPRMAPRNGRVLRGAAYVLNNGKSPEKGSCKMAQSQYPTGPDVIWETEAFGLIHAQIIGEIFDPEGNPDTARFPLLLRAEESPQEIGRDRRHTVFGAKNLRTDTTMAPAQKKAAGKKATAAKKTAAKAATRKGGSNSESNEAPAIPALKFSDSET